jgi:hypothetical protein
VRQIATIRIAAFMLICFASAAIHERAAGDAKLEDGYRALFDGHDLSQWEGADGPADACWKIEDDVLIGLEQKGPWLRSREEFGDFNLRLDYRVDPGANSGVYVRVPADGNHHRDTTTEPPAGFEVQVIDDSARKYGKLKDYQFCGSVYDLAGPKTRVSRPPGEWNSLEINCLGNHVVVVHNDVKIVDVTPTSHPLVNLRQRQGYLGLQNHGGGVSFRNIRIGPPREPASAE